MNLMFVFCLYMTFIYLPFDLFLKPIERDEEVWFGFVLRGVWAKATEPLHWAIYAAGAWGFWKMKSWMWPWAAVYCAQVAIGMVVWSILDPRGAPWMGLVAGAVFLVPTIALWRARPVFRSSTAEQTVRATATPSR